MRTEERLAATLEWIDADEVGQEVGPTVEVRRVGFAGDAFGAGFEKAFDEFGALSGIGVGEELAGCVGLGQAAGYVEMDAADKLGVGTERGDGNTGLLGDAEYVIVNEIGGFGRWTGRTGKGAGQRVSGLLRGFAAIGCRRFVMRVVRRRFTHLTLARG